MPQTTCLAPFQPLNSGTVELVLLPPSPRGWDFVVLHPHFLGAISRTLSLTRE